MACLMNFSEPLSLLKLTARKIVLGIWNRRENLDLILELHPQTLRTSYDESVSRLNSIIIRVGEQVETTQLPRELKEEVKLLMRPIGLEVLKWLNFHGNYIHYPTEYEYHLDELSWTYQGTIDYEKTIKNIVDHKNLSLIAKYQLCCLFCLEDDLQVVWRDLTGEEKLFCLGDEAGDGYHEGILNYWTSVLRRDFNVPFDCMWVANLNHCTIIQYAFENAAFTGNLVATQFFASKLKPEEKDSLLRTTHIIGQQMGFKIAPEVVGFPTTCFRDIFSFLLTQLKDDEQLEFLELYPEAILRCYMDWPRQNVVHKVLEKLWPVFPHGSFQMAMSVIAENMHTSPYDYPKLFEEIFLLSPLDYKMALLQKQCDFDLFLSFLFDDDDKDIIKLVLSFADSELKQKIFNSPPSYRICLSLIKKNEWHLIDFFINQCTLSKETRLKVIENFKDFLPDTPGYDFNFPSLESSVNRFYNMLLQRPNLP